MLVVLLLGCESEPGPGEVGYVECGDTPVDPANCDPLSYCCEVLDEAGRHACEYLTNGLVFTCEGLACEVASDNAIDAACDLTPDTGE
jgi:hypothetical protein